MVRKDLLFTAFLYTFRPPGIEEVSLESLELDKQWKTIMYPTHTNEGPEKVYSRMLRAGKQDDGSFLGLLPYLCGPGRGGNPLTEAIGAAVRSLGAGGFVYPSARNYVCSRFEGDRLIEHALRCCRPRR